VPRSTGKVTDRVTREARAPAPTRDAGPDPRCYRVDFSKIAQRLPGFRPGWDVRRGAIELRDAFQKLGLSRDDLEGDRYLRIRRIKRLLDEGRLDRDLRWKAA